MSLGTAGLCLGWVVCIVCDAPFGGEPVLVFSVLKPGVVLRNPDVLGPPKVPEILRATTPQQAAIRIKASLRGTEACFVLPRKPVHSPSDVSLGVGCVGCRRGR